MLPRFRKMPNAARHRHIFGALAVLALVTPALAACSGAAAPAAQTSHTNAALEDGIIAYRAGDYAAALQEFQPLAKGGNAEADYWLGQMYEQGFGVKQDAAKAVSYYETAAKAGWSDAKLRLGEIYMQGNEELQNFTKAHKWLESAAYDGMERAQLDLGKLYANGWGGKKDPVWAYMWYEFAARQGDFDAEKLRNALLKTMTAAQISEAQKLTQKIAPEVFGAENAAPAKASATKSAETSAKPVQNSKPAPNTKPVPNSAQAKSGKTTTPPPNDETAS